MQLQVANKMFDIKKRKFKRSSKRVRVREKRWRNWKRRRKKLKRATYGHHTKKTWDSYPIDCFVMPDGTNEAILFEEVCKKYEDFYLFGIREDFMLPSVQSPHTSELLGFLGQSNDDLTELFLPDRKGFLYYNDALEDIPVIFDTGATVSVSPDIRDFEDFEPCMTGLNTITGNSKVTGFGTIIL